MTKVIVTIIGIKTFSVFCLSNFDKRAGAKNAPNVVPKIKRPTSSQSTLPSPRCIKKPVAEIPIKTKTTS